MRKWAKHMEKVSAFSKKILYILNLFPTTKINYA